MIKNKTQHKRELGHSNRKLCNQADFVADARVASS